jgi:hypothetical protein
MRILLGLVAITFAGTGSVSSVASQRDIVVVGVDYAFQIPPTLPAGRMTFHFRNSGKRQHEFNIVLLKEGVTPEQFLQAVKANQPQMIMVDKPVGVLFAEPGKVGAYGLTTNLVAGRTYVVICIARDSAKALRHVDMGMSAIVQVIGPRVAAPSQQSATDTIVGVNYAFKYRGSVAPGRHTFLFRNEGTVRHEAFIGLLKKGVTLDSLEKVDKAGGDTDPLIESAGGLLYSAAGQTPAGTLQIDMPPGREYVLFCTFSDDAKSPPHYKLGMVGSIRAVLPRSKNLRRTGA